MADSGYIKLHRKLLNWCWWHDLNTRSLFIYLLLAANWEDKHFHNITVKRGQLVTSVASLSKNVGISAKAVRVALNHLKTTNEVAIETTNKWTLITVVNYEKYQLNELKRANKRASSRTNEGQTKGKQRATTKEDKEDKEFILKSSSKRTVIDLLTDDENDELDSLVRPEHLRELIDMVDSKFVGRDYSEIRNPLRYLLTVAKEQGFLKN